MLVVLVLKLATVGQSFRRVELVRRACNCHSCFHRLLPNAVLTLLALRLSAVLSWDYLLSLALALCVCLAAYVPFVFNPVVIVARCLSLARIIRLPSFVLRLTARPFRQLHDLRLVAKRISQGGSKRLRLWHLGKKILLGVVVRD